MDKALVNNHLKDIMTFLKEDYEAYKVFWLIKV